MNFLLLTLGEFLITLLQVVVETPLMWIGEITLYLITLGRHKPRWDTYFAEGGGDFAFLSAASFWIGIITVGLVGTAIKRLIF